MTQNSLSPVVKSRISSSSGRTMSVEKRSLARTGTMSSFAYFTTRAEASVAAAAGEAWNAAALKTTKAKAQKKSLYGWMRNICFIDVLLLKWIGVAGNFDRDRNGVRETTARQERAQ